MLRLSWSILNIEFKSLNYLDQKYSLHIVEISERKMLFALAVPSSIVAYCHHNASQLTSTQRNIANVGCRAFCHWEVYQVCYDIDQVSEW